MEALSHYANWESFLDYDQQLDYSDMDSLFAPPQTELPPELLSLPNPWNIDHFFEPNDLFFPENDSNPLLYDQNFSAELNSLTPTEPFLLQQEFQPFHYQKRQKFEPLYTSYEEIYPEFKPNPFSSVSPFPDPTCLELENPIMPPLPDHFPTAPPPVFSTGSTDQNIAKKDANMGTLSSQSIAARQRRRKITEKTHELGKLIPGGQKMNTAEMLQSAYKYIKFLQAQVGILEFVDSYNQENGGVSESKELHNLLESPLIQEKLSSSEKCLVPEKFVRELSSDRVQPEHEKLPTVKEELII